jgi:hypothetical protein
LCPTRSIENARITQARSPFFSVFHSCLPLSLSPCPTLVHLSSIAPILVPCFLFCKSKRGSV